MSVKVRFAPSPTGNIHIGNARPALINWLFARKNGGKFVLRFDDTDVERSREEYANGISRDLAWLGITPDQVEKQSERFDVYSEATKKLKEAGVLYACYETPDQLERQRKRLAARGKPPVYDRSGLRVDDEQRKEFEAEGIKPHWRFLLPNFEKDPFEPRRTEISWVDVIRGPQTVDLSSMSDPVLIRADGTWLYTLPSVVDDIEFGITHVIRGDDHVTNTGAQIAIFRALGAEPPEFGHHNLLTTETGEGLSKRLGSLSLQQLAEDGYEAMAVASLAVLTGTSGPVDALEDMEALIERFDPATITKSAAKFDPSELKSLNRRLVHALEYGDVAERLKLLGADGGEAFWTAIRDNLDFVKDARFWFDVIENAKAVIDPEDADFIQEAKSLMPAEPWNEETWGQWVSALKDNTDRKGKNLFMPLRKAVTGLEHGPELDRILPLIGRDRMSARLS